MVLIFVSTCKKKKRYPMSVLNSLIKHPAFDYKYKIKYSCKEETYSNCTSIHFIYQPPTIYATNTYKTHAIAMQFIKKIKIKTQRLC